MKPYRLLLLSIFLIPILIFSQNRTSLAWGPTIKKKKKANRISVVATLPNSFICLKRFNKIPDRKGKYFTNQFELSSFSHDGTPLQKHILKLGGLPADPDYIGFIQYREELGLIYEYYDAKQQQYLFEKRAIDPEQLEFSEEAILLSSHPGNLDLNQRDYSIIYSPNHSHILLFKKNWNEGRSKVLSLDFLVFNEDFIQVSRRTFESEYLSNHALSPSILISDQGEIYFALHADPSNPRSLGSGGKSPKKELQYLIYALALEAGSDRITRIKSPDYFIKNLRLNLDKQGNIIANGLYSHTNRLTAHGLVTFTLEVKNQVLSEPMYQRFPDEFLKDHLKSIDYSKDNGIKNWEIKNCFYHQDGDRILLMENFEIMITQTGNPDIQSISYHFGNILVIKLDSDGKITWIKDLPKLHKVNMNFAGDNLDYSSFYTHFEEKGIYLVFNDHKENFDSRAKGLTTYQKGKENIIALVQIDENGNLTQKMLQKEAKGKQRLVPSQTFRSYPHTSLLYLELPKSYQWLQLKVGE